MAFLLLAALALIFAEDPMPNRYSADVPDDFEHALVETCREALSDGERRCDPIDLLKCWKSESDVSHAALNANGWAAGIFQVMPDTARTLGWASGDARWTLMDEARERFKAAEKAMDHNASHVAATQVSAMQQSLARQFTQLSATEQLAYARRFYGAHRGSLTSPAHCYTATFLPAELPHASDPAHVLCARPGVHPDYPAGKYPWAYDANHGAFDPEAKGWIAVGDLTARIDRVATGPRWEELRSRVEAAQCSGPDLATVGGVQCALSRLGFDPGPLDGSYGPRTRAACIAFQTDRALEDRSGAITDETRDALRESLASAA